VFKKLLAKNNELYLLVLVFFLLSLLHIIHLGYSEDIPDEGIIINTLKHQGGFSWGFLLNQRKGPLQFLVSLVPYLFSKNVYNEFLFRLPYSLASIFSLVFFYLFVREYSKDKYIALVSAYVLGINGFLVAFGRVMQYQSLNLLFSSLSIYLFSKKKYILGTPFFGLSLLSHWDALLVLPIIIYLVIRDFSFKNILKIILTTCLVVLPFIIPYTQHYLLNRENQKYFSARVSLEENFSLSTIQLKISDYVFKTNLYNPFLFLITLLLISLFSVFLFINKGKNNFIDKKDLIALWIWFISIFLVFIFLVKSAGTHVYNLYLPLSILCGYGGISVSKVIEFKNIYITLIMLWFVFLYIQALSIFVDVKNEYPFEQKSILGLVTKEYDHENLTNNIIGFNHFRNWELINTKLKELGAASYYTNEDTSVSNFYMNIPYSSDNYDYAVGIKRPISFTNDYKLSTIKGKSTVYEVKSNLGETVARIYVLDEKSN